MTTHPRHRSCRRAPACPGVEKGKRSRGVGVPGCRDGCDGRWTPLDRESHSLV